MQQSLESAIHIGHDGLEHRDEDRARVLEVVMEDPLADARLAGHALHPQSRGAVARKAPDRRVNDLLAT